MAATALAALGPGCQTVPSLRGRGKPKRGMQITTVVGATREYPRHDAGAIIELNDGSLMLAWMAYEGSQLQGNDHAPCHIASMASQDGGSTWTDRRVLVENHPDDTNLHFPWFLRSTDGGILFYHHIHERREQARNDCTACEG